MRTTRAAVLAAVVALAGAGVLGAGCRSAMRGAPYKRLISSYAETVHLQDLTGWRLMEAAEAGESPDRIEAVAAIHDEVTLLRERWHDSLDRRRREYFNRTTMNKLWGRYVALYPEDKDLREEYRGQRRVAVDEIRSRRTPLTHDARLPWAKPPVDPLPYGPEAKRPRPEKVTGPSVAASSVPRSVPQRDFLGRGGAVAPAQDGAAREGAWMAPGPAAGAGGRGERARPSEAGEITIEPTEPDEALPEAAPRGGDPTEEMLLELLEEQGRRPRGG